MDPSLFILTLLTGLATGMFLVLVSSGLTIVFGMQGILNFAHGSFYMLGAYLALTLLSHMDNFLLMAPIVFMLTALSGAVLERLIIRRLAGRAPLHHLMVTFGAALVIGEAVKQIWGPQVQFAPVPDFLGGVAILGSIVFPKYYLFTLVFSTVLMVAGWLAFTRTVIGLRIQAVTSDREMAAALGIRAARLNTVVFATGAGIAGLTGMLAAPVLTIYPSMDLEIITTVFAVVIFGGLGDLRGTLIGGLIIGLILAFGTTFVGSTLAQVIVFTVMAATVIVRPNGLFGRPGIID